MVIFPEGTRVAFGETPPLQPGFRRPLPGARAAGSAGRRTTAASYGRAGFVKQSGTIHFKVGEVIPPGLKRDEVEARVHAAINALELPAQGRAKLLRRGDDLLRHVAQSRHR